LEKQKATLIQQLSALNTELEETTVDLGLFLIYLFIIYLCYFFPVQQTEKSQKAKRKTESELEDVREELEEERDEKQGMRDKVNK
jgi:hypothetical protein